MIYEAVILNLLSTLLIISGDSQYPELAPSEYQEIDPGLYLCIKGAYWISVKSSFIQYCDSNIGLFSFAPHLVIDLPTL